MFRAINFEMNVYHFVYEMAWFYEIAQHESQWKHTYIHTHTQRKQKISGIN